MNNTLKSTRLRIALALLVFATVAFYAGKLSEPGWIDLVKWVFGIYSGSEGVRYGAAAVKGKQS